MIANFGDAPYVYENVRIPVGAIACHLKSGEIEVFVPAAN